MSMLKRSRLAAGLLALLVLAPVLAAGRPACCVKTPAAPAAHACCPAMAQAQAMAPKGCCKVPVAPKPETKMRDGAPMALSIASSELGSPALASIAIPEVAGVRLARRAHHAEAPDDSPPDLLAQIHVLLI
jgi:hypothetical protein